MLFQSLELDYELGLGPDPVMPCPVIRFILRKGILGRCGQYKIVKYVFLLSLNFNMSTFPKNNIVKKIIIIFNALEEIWV